MSLRLRKEVRWFAEQMELKLRENDHKGHWCGCGIVYLNQRLKEETAELRRVIGDQSKSQQIIGEAADVANFCMMIADNSRT